MPEFDLIRRLQDIIDLPGTHDAAGCVLGIGDDAALLQPVAGQHLAVCTDTLVEGVHFPAGTCPRAVGYKSLAVNLSDLAAMGAEPAWFFLNLVLPGDDADWLDAFARGMAGLAHASGIILAGGDTTSGSLGVTVTAVGHVAPGQALTRAGARPGDRILVSGETGRAAHALRCLADGTEAPAECLEALEYPRPRLALGAALRGLATACIDISDGLAADLGHILARSGTGAELDIASLPTPACLSGLDEEQRWALQLTGGDDYELCFTVPPEMTGRLEAAGVEAGVALTEIGVIRQEPGLVINRPDGIRYQPGAPGFQHFTHRPGPGAGS